MSGTGAPEVHHENPGLRRGHPAPAAQPGPPSRAAAAAALAAVWLAAGWAVCMTDLRIWLRRPWQVVGTLLVPLSYTLVAVLGSAATAANPVAVVNADHGPAGAQIAAAIVSADVFRVSEVSAPAARQMYADNQVAAIITIPADTTAMIDSHQQVASGSRSTISTPTWPTTSGAACRTRSSAGTSPAHDPGRSTSPSARAT